MQNTMSTSDHAAFPVCLNFLFQKSVFIGVYFGISWHSIAGSSFTSDFSFHGFESLNESCTTIVLAVEDRKLGLNMSDPEEGQLSAWSDAASSKRHSKKRPREVSEKRSVSEAGGMTHDVMSKQHNEKAHRSFQVNSERISNNFPRPKGGGLLLIYACRMLT